MGKKHKQTPAAVPAMDRALDPEPVSDKSEVIVALPAFYVPELGPRGDSPPLIGGYRPTPKAYAAIACLMERMFPGVDHHSGHMHAALDKALEALADSEPV